MLQCSLEMATQSPMAHSVITEVKGLTHHHMQVYLHLHKYVTYKLWSPCPCVHAHNAHIAELQPTVVYDARLPFLQAVSTQLLRKLLQIASRKMTVQRKVSTPPVRTGPATSTVIPGMTRTGTGIGTGTSTGHHSQTDTMEAGIAAGTAAEIGTKTEAEVTHSSAETAGKAQGPLEPAEAKMNGK